MKVKMLTSMSGPNVQRNRGDEIDLPNGEAASLIKAGFAQAVRDETRETTSRRGSRETTAVEPEVAEVPAAGETPVAETVEPEKAGE